MAGHNRLIFILIIFSYATLSLTTNTNDNKSFGDEIQTLQNSTRVLGYHLENKMLIDAKTMRTLMRDAHRDCPDNNAMEVTLVNLQQMADKYYSNVKNQLEKHKELQNMLTKGLESGDMIIFSLMEGKYSYVASIIEKWHQELLKFRMAFYVMEMPLEVMLENKKVFYYDNWMSGILKFIISWVTLIFLLFILFQLTLWLKKTTIIIVLSCAIVLGLIGWNPYMISFPKPLRRNWYSSATTLLDKMIIDRDYSQSEISQQIETIVELLRHVNMYSDPTVQTNVNELIDNLGKGIRQANNELATLHTKTDIISSAYRQAGKSIAEKAAKAGRLDEAHDLLVILNESAEKYERMQKNIEVLVTHQKNVLPTLLAQTKSMRQLVQEDRFIELRHVIGHHQEILLDIDGNTYKVQVEIKDMIEILSTDDTDGLKKTIEKLKDQTVTDQLTAMVAGAASAAGSTLMGVVALKSGFAIVSVTATAVAAPVVATASVVGLGYYTIHNLYNYKGASRYKTELDILETKRINWKIAMEQYEKAIDDQQNALKISQSALNRIETSTIKYSRISSFTLESTYRAALSEELLKVETHYNRMIAFYSLFDKSTTSDREALPQK